MINGNATAAANHLHHGLLTYGGVSNLLIESNTFGGTADQLIYVNGTPSVGVASTNVDLIDNNFSGTASTGVVLESSGGEVSDNTFGSGIASNGTALSLPVAGNTVEDNDFSAVGTGFDISTIDTFFDMTTNPTAEKLAVRMDAPAGATVIGNDLGNTIRGNNVFGDNLSGGDGDDTLEGRAGDDTLKGGEGDDSLYGNSTATPLGAGVDKATYDQAIDSSHVSTNGAGGWTVTTGGVEGTDTLVDVEQVDGAGAGKILLVGNGGYLHDRRRIDAAVGWRHHHGGGRARMTSPQRHQVGDHPRRQCRHRRGRRPWGRVIITGGVRIADTDVTLDGFKITGAFDTTTSDGTDVDNGILVTANNATITNSVLDGAATVDARSFSTFGANSPAWISTTTASTTGTGVPTSPTALQARSTATTSRTTATKS